MSSIRPLLALLVLLAVLLGSPAFAQNIVQDPGFESANVLEYVSAPSYLSDGVWQVSSGTLFSYSVPGGAHTGSHWISWPFAGTLQQSLNTTPGRRYDISFWLWSDGKPFTVTFGGFSTTITDSFWGYKQHTFTGVPATSATTILSFSGPSANNFLDDVSVTLSAADPLDLTEALGDDVAALVALGVTLPADGQSLYAKLDAAAAALEVGDTATAIVKLTDFINQVDAFVKTGKLTNDQGRPLIDAADAILDML